MSSSRRSLPKYARCSRATGKEVRRGACGGASRRSWPTCARPQSCAYGASPPVVVQVGEVGRGVCGHRAALQVGEVGRCVRGHRAALLEQVLHLQPRALAGGGASPCRHTAEGTRERRVQVETTAQTLHSAENFEQRSTLHTDVTLLPPSFSVRPCSPSAPSLFPVLNSGQTCCPKQKRASLSVHSSELEPIPYYGRVCSNESHLTAVCARMHQAGSCAAPSMRRPSRQQESQKASS